LASLTLFWQPSALIWLCLGLFCSLSVTLYVFRGWQLSGVGSRGLVDLFRIPTYMVWKFLLMLRTQASAEWVRTKRE
jgi:hypothetical protein